MTPGLGLVTQACQVFIETLSLINIKRFDIHLLSSAPKDPFLPRAENEIVRQLYVLATLFSAQDSTSDVTKEANMTVMRITSPQHPHRASLSVGSYQEITTIRGLIVKKLS